MNRPVRVPPRLAVGGPKILQGSRLCGRRDRRDTARPLTVMATNASARPAQICAPDSATVQVAPQEQRRGDLLVRAPRSRTARGSSGRVKNRSLHSWQCWQWALWRPSRSRRRRPPIREASGAYTSPSLREPSLSLSRSIPSLSFTGVSCPNSSAAVFSEVVNGPVGGRRPPRKRSRRRRTRFMQGAYRAYGSAQCLACWRCSPSA